MTKGCKGCKHYNKGVLEKPCVLCREYPKVSNFYESDYYEKEAKQ